MSVSIKSNELVKAILESEEYKKLILAKQQINKNTQFRAKIKELKEKQHELQVAMIQNKADKSKIDGLNRVYNESVKFSEIKQYLDIEKHFSDFVIKVLQDISGKIENSLK